MSAPKRPIDVHGPISDHGVVFYEDEDSLLRQLTAYVAAGLGAGGHAVVIATPAHIAALRDRLSAAGIDPVRREEAGELVIRDAEQTLATFMVGGMPDPARLEASLAPLFASIPDGVTASAFGEMVALLWAAGDSEGALALEEMWNDLQDRYGFRLLCGYPRDVLRHSDLSAVTAVCRRHSDFAADPGGSDAGDAATATSNTEVFLPSPRAVADARRFVRRALSNVGGTPQEDDIVLVACELVTNSVRHATSAFRVTVRQSARSIRVEVEDVSPYAPKVGRAGPSATGGRGLVLVERLANNWGHFRTDSGGKVVWAEFSA